MDNKLPDGIRSVRTMVIDVNKANGPVPPPGKSKKIEDEPFATLINEGKVIAPPFHMLTLATLQEQNTELTPCLEAMEVNVVGFGYRLISRIKSEDGEKLAKPVLEEKVFLDNFFGYCTDESYTDFRRKLRKDLEATGNSYYEVVRDSKNNVQSFAHIPSYQVLLGKLDEEPYVYDRPILQLQMDGSVKLKTIKQARKFRKYVQSRNFRTTSNVTTSTSYKTVWFKEFGDPRIMNYETGEYDDNTPEDKRANEIVHRRIYSPRTPYGLPRIIGQLLSVYGARAAEEINFITFKNNNVPSMIIAVSNGQLNEASVQRIQEYAESIKDSNDYSKFLLLEAEGLMEGEDGGQMKIDVKPLTNSQHKDALFQNYSKNAKENIRRSFRLPPIFVGSADDYTRATADSSRILADEQIFSPERTSEDEFMNRIMFPHMGVIYHTFRTNTPNTTDNQNLVKILAGAEKTGGMSPRIARMLLQDILGMELPPFPDDFKPDVPFSMTMAEAVKNMAEPSEPGQQVTALKALYGDDNDDNTFIDFLLKARTFVEKKWSSEMDETHDHDHDHEHE
jgi:PBSX family phage portal protein